ncbi:MAG: RNA polymerase sigma factor [Chloroflexi bacterium]|nr:RNA polymerase sigma factor [Chloroflexota bacterium]MBU1749511.1 RNA polymerase sigma factor [Chloroflexota bacterium]MBU1879546.1 RNA polymerase sigma factor [Chloroflexota bacterium]
MQQDEQILVQQAQQGDPGAFALLYDWYVQKIYNYIVMRVGDVETAQDLTADVFLKALESLDSFEWRGYPFSSWLFRIAHNQVVDYLRRQDKRRYAPLLDEALPMANGLEPFQMMEKQSSREQLLAALGQLTDIQREIIALRFASELPISQVAGVLGISEGAVKARQHSALSALRRIMSVEAT